MTGQDTFPGIPGYKIQRRLGSGGMADVFLGTQEVLDRQVAIKILSPEMFRNPQVVQRFLNEARTASKLQHPNIVTIHDVGQVQNSCYIVMEYLQESLNDRLRFKPGHRIEPLEAFKITKKIAEALIYAHSQGFIHRDIKPDNILFRRDDTPVLVDFGIARAMDAESRLTATGLTVGTPHYMSPEQCVGEDVDGQSDIYSLGIVLYEMLTGDVPFKADSTKGILVKHINQPIPPLPADLQKYQPILEKMTAKEKSRRITGGPMLLDLLDHFSPARSRSGLDSIEARHEAGWVFQGGDSSRTEVLYPTDHQPAASSPYLPHKRKKTLFVMIMLFILVGAAAAAYFLDILPWRIGSGVPGQEEKEIVISEPEIQTLQNEAGSSTKKDIEGTALNVPDNSPQNQLPGKTKGNEMVQTRQKDEGTASVQQGHKNSQSLLEQAEQFLQKGELDNARQSLEQARAIEETEQLKTLEKRLQELKAEQQNRQFNHHLQQAEVLANKGLYAKALEQLTAAGKIKQDAKWESLTRQIKKKETEARRKAEQERIRRQRDDQAFNEAKAANNIMGYEKYLKLFPSGLHADDAQKRLEQLRSAIKMEIRIEDDIAFETAVNANTLEAFDKYLKKFPVGLHGAEARKRIQQLQEKIVKETSAHITIQQIKFFESDFTPPPLGQRSYATNFNATATRYIFTEIRFKNNLFRVADSTNRVMVEYSGSAGAFNYQLKGMIRQESGAETGVYWRGMGWSEPGKWPAGSYRITVYFDDQPVSKASFSIQ